MQEGITLTGFVQGRVDIVVKQSYGSEYKASGWINLEPVFSYQKPTQILRTVSELNKDKFPQFKFQLSMRAVPVFNKEDELVTIYDVDFIGIEGEEE